MKNNLKNLKPLVLSFTQIAPIAFSAVVGLGCLEIADVGWSHYKEQAAIEEKKGSSPDTSSGKRQGVCAVIFGLAMAGVATSVLFVGARKKSSPSLRG